MTVEFKRDDPVSEGDIVAAAVCLANTDGGTLFLGVDDTGRVTGAASGRDADRVRALISNRTSPRLVVEVEQLEVDGAPVVRIQVPRMPGPVMRSDGLYQRRLLKQDGTPECVPMQPHEVTVRANEAGPGDPSAETVRGATVADLNPVERARLQRTIAERPNADRRLLDMGPEVFDDTLALTREVDGTRVPTLTGLLLLGHIDSLRRLVPQHEVSIQVFSGTEVPVNRFDRTPLLATLDDLNRQFATVPAEGELAVGLQRVPIPSLDADAFREAVLNAFAHRDYGRVGTVRVAFKEDELEVSSPGGLVPGVMVDRLLTTPPTPRNRALADALMRLGLVERSARGVDRIFEGQVRYGRPLPDYRDTTSEFVLVRLSRAPADRVFYAALLDVERHLNAGTDHEPASGAAMSARPRRLPVEQIIVLAALRRERRLTLAELAVALQRPEDKARPILAGMEQLGRVTAQGKTRARFYVLGPVFLRLLGPEAAAVVAAGLPSLAHQEESILTFVRERGEVRRNDVVRLLPLTEEQATERLVRMSRSGRLQRRGVGRGTFYVVGAASEFDVMDAT